MTPSWAEMIRVFGRIGCLSFGGPAAQIALMHRELVEERPWIAEEDYLKALSLCMLLPGPEAMQLATYAGWRLRGVPGGLLGGGLFVLPGALVIFALAFAYGAWGALPGVQAAFLGVKAAVIAIVVLALVKVAQRALRRPSDRLIALLAFATLALLHLPYPLVVAGAALWGALRTSQAATEVPPAPGTGTRGVSLVFAALWLLPLGLIVLAGPPLLGEVAVLFSVLAVVTFGGAYAVLAWLTQVVVTDKGWLTAAQMIDALGLAETTPGPLILVTQFTATLAGLAEGGPALALMAGGVALWATFLPCFLWIFALAPGLERLTARPRLRGALEGVTAAVVGVIGALSLWFGSRVLFDTVERVSLGPLALDLPVWQSWNPLAIGIALAAWAALGPGRMGLLPVLALSSLAGLAFAAG